MAVCRPFSIYKRLVGRKKRVIFYVQFRDENGKRLPGRSSGQSSKSAAEVWAIEQLAKGIIPTKANLTFSRYAEPWFIWGKCEYIQRKMDRGISISRGYADTRRINLVKNILPFFGSNKLTSIKPYMVESWIKELQKSSLSPATINICLRTLKLMMKEAMRKGYIDRDPTEYVGNLKETRKQRAILTLAEVRQLFDKQNMEQIWGGNYNLKSRTYYNYVCLGGSISKALKRLRCFFETSVTTVFFSPRWMSLIFFSSYISSCTDRSLLIPSRRITLLIHE